jgi:hypothetical protein
MFRFINLNNRFTRMKIFSWLTSKPIIVRHISARALLAYPAVVLLVLLLASAAYATNPPAISPSYRVFSSGPQTVTITGTAGNSFFYTTDGTNPGLGSTPYSLPFSVSATTTVKAVAYDGTTLSAITTSIVQIDSTTSTVPSSGLKSWYKADNGAIVSSGSVTTWKDVSGSGSDASQSTSTAQPTYNSSAINGLPAVVFNGTSDYLNMPAGFSNFASGLSIFLVTKPTTWAYGQRVFAFGNTNTSGSNCLVLEEPTNTSLSFDQFDSGGNVASVVSNSAVTLGSYQLYEITHDGTSTGTMYADAVQIAKNTAMYSTSSINPNYNYLGCAIGVNGFFAGEVAEVLIYNRLLTNSERLGVEEYLSGRYGFPPLPPSISPSYAAFASGPQSVTITDAMSAANFFYTVDGSTPTHLSTPYTGPFNVSNPATTVKAIAVVGSGTSSVTSSTIQIDPTTQNVSRTGLNLWLKADNGAIASGGSVSTWKDVSGNGLDATQGTSANQPTFDSTAINGLPALGFNGTGQYLALPTGFSNFTAGASIFVMAKPTVFYNAYARFIDLCSSPGQTDNLAFFQPAVSSLAFSVYGNPATNLSTVTASNALALNLYQLFEVTHDGTATATLYVNGLPLAENTAMLAIPNVNRSFNAIGEAGSLGPFYFEGEIAEILLYNRHLTDSERENVEAYLINRYLGGSAVATAPIFSLPTSTLPAPNQVAISGPVGSSILFSVDGSTPTQPYSGPIQINFTQTLKAVSVVNGVSSSVASITLTLDSAKYPSPGATDTRPLTINLQLPATAQ